jgi:hypothetical protein
MTKTFAEFLISEDKVTKNLTATYPAAPGEQHFVDKHIEYSPNDKFLVPNNGIFNAANKVKFFNRLKNRFGYDMNQSIKKFDENVELDDRLPNAHKKTKIRHFFDKDGHWLRTTTGFNTNKDALKNFIAMQAMKRRLDLRIVKENLSEDFKVGDKVHAGIGVKNGAGYTGHVVSVGDKHVHIKIGENKFGDRIARAHKSVCSKVNESITEGESIDEAFGRDRMKDFAADKSRKMKQTDVIDKKSDKVDKVKEFIKKKREVK